MLFEKVFQFFKNVFQLLMAFTSLVTLFDDYRRAVN